MQNWQAARVELRVLSFDRPFGEPPSKGTPRFLSARTNLIETRCSPSFRVGGGAGSSMTNRRSEEGSPTRPLLFLLMGGVH